ncbi:hypothetical protein Q9233_008181 [Columba guinea]|nr:hypothetical protein Q9233_008181 [Columba guinea]
MADKHLTCPMVAQEEDRAPQESSSPAEPQELCMAQDLEMVVAEGMAPPQRILFPPEKICMAWQHSQRAGAGLHNLGNTCFLNSVLQCLTYTPPLANHLLSGEHSRACGQKGFCIMCRMEVHVQQVLHSSASAIEPWAVVDFLTEIGENFQHGRQEDAHEFLRCTMDAMQRACLRGNSDLDMSSQATTIVHQIFGGFLRSRVTCWSCQAVSDSYEAFLDVPLDIKAAASVTAALEDFVKPEHLDGENCFKCSKCDKMTAASKRFTVHRAPKVLTVCLKRFEAFTGDKISKVVEYPQYLDLRPYMSQAAGEPLLYSLYAVLVHGGGSCRAGHYFCYIKASDGLWYRMNDKSVDLCDSDTVLRQQAYLLFYIRLVVFHQVFPISHLYLFPQTHEMADKHLTCPMVAQEEDRAPQESSSPAEPQELCMAQDLEMVVAEGMAPPQRILFPPEKICMAWQHSQRAGAGLHNLGNTCFLNSVLQCLTYTPPLANHLLSGEHSRACGQKGFCIMCRMEVHVQQVLHSSASAIEPWAVVDFLTEIGENFQHGRQEDAHEFLRCTMDAMQRACLRGNSDLDMSSQATTIVHQIFGGFLRSRVTCWSCQAVSDSYEAFLDVPLDIKAAASVTAALEDFVKPEHLDGENCFKCSKCDKMTAASKRFTVHRAPKVLTVCLKRFEAFTGDKISKVVEYPQYLDLRPYMSQAAGEPLLYSLYAVLVHGGGSCRAGHYFCYIKASDGLWYRMNDKSVDLCDSDTVLRQQAYLLFYIRLVVFHQVFPIPHLYLFPQTHEMADKHLTCPMVAQEEDRAPQESSSPAEPQELCMAQDLEMVVAEGMAPPQRILFPPEKICMAWQHSQRAGAGLHNLGNTCFLNSVLQCLTYTPPLANHLLSGEHSRACGQKGFCVMCRMEVHVQQVLHSSASAIEPWAVVDFLTEIGENFQHGRQEDAHEFLRCTMDAMQRACLRGNSDLDMSSQATTIVHQIFGGFLRSRVTCWSCQAVSDSYEAFLDVPLDIKAAASVTAALEDFVKPEHLDGENCFKCSKCDKMTAASKRFTVHRAPKVLTVCLKRFEAFTGDKISKVVEYPQYLDLRPYMSQAAGEPLLYSLYAVLVHGGGSCRAGHYFCYIKASDGLWYRMNDKSVDLCDSDTVLRQQAYLLFYIRLVVFHQVFPIPHLYLFPQTHEMADKHLTCPMVAQEEDRAPQESSSPAEPQELCMAQDLEMVVAEGMAPPQRILFPPEKICMAWQHSQRAGAGLHNLGNTCFLNSVLQCLTYTPPLANHLLSGEHSRACGQKGFCVMCRMEVHVQQVLHSSASAIEPWAVVDFLTEIGENFQHGRQEDAHEFLRCTMDAMQRASLRGKSDLDMSSQATTIVHQIFGGFLRSRVTCWSCQAVSDSYEAFLDVPLDIKAAASVTAALEDFVKPEHLDGENCFKCSKCDKMTAASKRFTVHRAPKVLTVCLKRFEAFTGDKISKVVEYPQYLDLRPYMSQAAGEPLLYSLYAVLVHGGGSCRAGHYFCYIKASDGLWYRMNDKSVDLCDSDTVLRQQAYLLFYIRLVVFHQVFPIPHLYLFPQTHEMADKHLTCPMVAQEEDRAPQESSSPAEPQELCMAQDLEMVVAEGMAPPQRILFPPEKICMAWQHSQRAGAGLHNLGNTCFLNSVLQCLTYTPPLANHLLSGEHSRACGQKGFCVMCRMEVHVQQVLHSSASAIEPWAVVDFLTEIGENFQHGRQEDAHEFLRCTMDAMQRACLRGNSDLDMSSQATTIVHQIFGGFLRSRVTCWSCQAVSDSYEAFLDVPLDIKAAASVTAALEDFVKPEHLDGENCFKCSKCDKMTAASKRFTVHRAPKVLTVCLKRFEAFTGDKISKVVEYPQYLDLRPYMSQAAGEPLLYSLYAVLVHGGGSCRAGHYFCYIKASDGLWYRMNDKSVDLCDSDTVLRQQAYLLFYIRLVVFHQVFPIPHLYLFPQTHEMADKHLTCPMVAQEEDRAPQESSSPAEPQELCMAQDLEMVVAEGMAPPQRILFPPEKICMAWQHSQRAGAGLHNLGNTCFLNSVLQCLTYTPPLANHLLSGEHSRACGQKGFCVMCRMEVHVQQVLHSSASAIEPWAVVDFLTEIGENFQHGRQEDAHEFLRCTMDAMQRACLRGNSDLDMFSQATTIVHQIFGGFLRSRVTCWSCQAVSDSYEAFLDVPLDIKAAASVTAALEDFVKPEHLDGENCFKCSKCDKMTAASKRFTVHRAPKVLTVCLKRFEAFTGDKISKVVEYPQYLDLRPYMSQAAGEPLLYSLYAVLVHGGGSCRAGHYFCYIKASDGLWYRMNDKSVDLCDSDTVLRQQAYLLFYIRLVVFHQVFPIPHLYLFPQTHEMADKHLTCPMVAQEEDRAPQESSSPAEPQELCMAQDLEMVVAEGMAPPQRILFPPEKICMAWQHSQRAGAGLHNLGNTCFLNSVLQCLTYTPPLANHLLSGEHSRACGQKGFCVMCRMEVHVQQVLHSSASAIEPWAVVDFLTEIGENFQHGRQEDAHEFLRCTMDAMQRACLRGNSDLDMSSQATTIVHQIFGGFLRSRVTCWSCQAVSDSYEAFLDVPLDIKAAASVTAALEDFVKPEHLDGENCFKCSKCDKMTAASKRFTVHRAPKVLTVCLKRFEAFTGDKISKVVEYPQYLDLRPYMSQAAGEPLLYSLYAVLVHGGGSCRAGHYFCYIKASDGLWYRMNDKSVDLCDSDTVLRQQAYLLFYIRLVVFHQVFPIPHLYLFPQTHEMADKHLTCPMVAQEEDRAPQESSSPAEPQELCMAQDLEMVVAEGMAPPQRILFPPEKICMAWQHSQRAGAGLHNLGNTCFLNSVLQCLTYTPPLANHLLSGEHSRACGQKGFCIMCRMEVHVQQVLHSSASAIEPWAVVDFLTEIGENFQHGRQEDAHEFLRCTMDAMQRACLRGNSDLDMSSQATTIVHQIFGGFLRSRVTCWSCQAVSDSYEAFLDVPLDIKAAASVTAALEDFVKPEHLDGENCFKCSKCDKMTAASKRFTVHRTPKVLTVCLKRFEAFTGDKISKVVEYPQYLDLRPYMSQAAGEPLLYSLYAVLVHGGGSCRAGHYFCYIKASDGLWYRMNDKSVDLCDSDTVLRQQAYLLFYIR